MNGIADTYQSLIDNPSKFLDVEKLKVKKELLDSKISNNLSKIIEKKTESSKVIEFDSLKTLLSDIKELINLANKSIESHNKTVANISQEKLNLTAQVWKFILEKEIKDELAKFQSKRKGLQQAIESLTNQKEQKLNEYKSQNSAIKTLEKDATSIQPTIDAINDLLKSFGFTGFCLAKSEKERFYKIQRPDGTNAKETLSEGEKTFITFLYFYHLRCLST